MDVFLQSLGLERITRNEPKPLLNIAALFGHLMVVKLLVQHGMDPHQCDRERSLNALHEACLKGKLDVVRYLIGIGVNVNAKTVTGETGLHLAAKSGHIDVAEYLLQHDADVKHFRLTGHTALHFAAARGDIPLARLMLDAGADIEASQLDGVTPLYISAERGQMYMTRFLIKRGAKVDRPCTEQKRTPLHVASSMGHLAVIEALLMAGANLHAKNTLLQRPEEIIGTRKVLSVVERGLIESTFSRFKKNKKLQEKKRVKGPSTSHDDSPQRRQSTSPRCREITTPSLKASARDEQKQHQHQHQVSQTETIPQGTDPANEEDAHSATTKKSLSPTPQRQELPSQQQQQQQHSQHQKISSETPTVTRKKLSIVDQIAAQRSNEGFRLFDIKELISKPNPEGSGAQTDRQYGERPLTARTSRRASFSWSRLQRQPGSARADYQHVIAESPRRPFVVKGESRRFSRRNNNLSNIVTHVPAESTKEAHSPRKSHPAPADSPDATPEPFSPPQDSAKHRHAHEHRPSGVFKRFHKSKRGSTIQDSGTQTDKTCFRAVRSELNGEMLDHKGRSTLFVAANNGNIGMLDRLLDSGMDPNLHAEEHGWTPLYASSRNGHLEVVRKLLDHGALVNETINSGATALHGASAFGQEQVARLLIERGAKLDMTTKHGELPLHTAARNGYMHVVSLLLSTDKSVIDKRRFSDGSTALHLAVEKQWAGAVKELIDWGADPGIEKEDGITSLYMTAISGNKSIAQMILASPMPFNVNIQTVENWTALHVACAR